jgi:hypothetical protein
MRIQKFSLTKSLAIKMLFRLGSLMTHRKTELPWFFTVTNKQKVFGISYELDGSSFKGSNIVRGYTWLKIQKTN